MMNFKKQFNDFINLVKNSLHVVKTRRGKFFLIVYVLAYVFAIGALVLTIYTLQNVGGSESVASTRRLFFDYGFSLGAVIMALQLFVGIFGIPFVLNLLVSNLEEFSFYKYASMFAFSAFEALGVYQFASHFLDMFHDTMALSILTTGRSLLPLLNYDKIISISTTIALFAFSGLLVIRVINNLKKK